MTWFGKEQTVSRDKWLAHGFPLSASSGEVAGTRIAIGALQSGGVWQRISMGELRWPTASSVNTGGDVLGSVSHQGDSFLWWTSGGSSAFAEGSFVAGIVSRRQLVAGLVEEQIFGVAWHRIKEIAFVVDQRGFCGWHRVKEIACGWSCQCGGNVLLCW